MAALLLPVFLACPSGQRLSVQFNGPRRGQPLGQIGPVYLSLGGRSMTMITTHDVCSLAEPLARFIG